MSVKESLFKAAARTDKSQTVTDTNRHKDKEQFLFGEQNAPQTPLMSVVVCFCPFKSGRRSEKFNRKDLKDNLM